eukprot:scaffold10422_cov36-Prasinocladus_malaysianus.AAC.1
MAQLLKCLLHLQNHVARQQRKEQLAAAQGRDGRSVVADSASSSALAEAKARKANISQENLRQLDPGIIPDEYQVTLGEITKLMGFFDDIPPEKYVPASLLHLMSEQINMKIKSPKNGAHMAGQSQVNDRAAVKEGNQ